MQRLLVLFLVAILVVAVAEGMVRAFSFRIGPPPGWPTLEMDQKSEQLKARDDVGVLFIGSSSTSVGIDPSVVVANSTAIDSSYNAALPFGSLEVQRLWSQAVMSDKVSVDVVVVEISPPVMLYRSKDSVAIDMVGSNPYGRLTGRNPGILDRSSLVTYAPDLRDPVAALRWIMTGPPRPTLSDGQTPLCRPYQFPKEFRDLIVSDFAASAQDRRFVALDDLRSLIDGLSARRIVFLIFPVAERYFEADGRLLPSWERELAQGLVFARDRDIAVIDATSIPWPQKYFSDPLHLNPAGAERLSEFVAGALDSIESGEPSLYTDRAYAVDDCRER